MIAALALVCAVAPTSASAAAGRASDGELSSRLAELAKPTVRSAPRAEQAEKLSLATEGPGSLLREGNRVLVEVRFDHGAAAGVDDLRASGAKVINVSRRYQTVTVAAKPSELRRLSAVPHVASATEVLTPIVHAAGGPGQTTAAITPCFGDATSEGDKQLRAAQARAEFEVDGSGVKVGILSDSFDLDSEAATDASEDVASGDLPGPGNPCSHPSSVEVIDEFVPFEPGEAVDEGRAMAQIVHDLAPEAPLAFATAFNGIPGFAENIEDLRDAGAEVIVDDVSYFEEPFFQEGPVGVAVSDVAASGVNYFSSAGNNNLIGVGSEAIASWEAPQYRDSSGCPTGVVDLSEFFEEESEPGLNPSHCMDFDPDVGVDTTFGITIAGEETLLVDLQWAEPWEGVSTDIDMYLLDPGGEAITGSIERNVLDSQRPFEFLAWENEASVPVTFQLAINRFEGSLNPPLKFALLQNGGGVTATEYESSLAPDVVGPTIFGHNGAEDGLSMGAIRYSTETAPESFSSRGPVVHYFEPVDGSTPADALVPPTELAKPDIVATDGGANTFFGSCLSDVWRFFGTSAAAPHAAAVAALQREAQPAATAAEVAQAQGDGAVGVGTAPPEAIGAGRVDAVAAIEQLGVTPVAPGAPVEGAPSPVSCAFVEPEPEPPVDGPPSTSDASEDDGSASDNSRPRTFFKKRPAKVVRTHKRRAKVTFKFGSNEEAVRFLCRVDRGPWRRCATRFVRRFRLGQHVLRVKARDAAGNTDRTPAVYRFRVKRVA